MILSADRVERLVLLDWQEDEPPPELDSLAPPGLPPSSVLVVRRVALLSAPASVPSAVVTEVADACRRAVRPVRGEVDRDAEAVLFTDEAELLACYLLAARDGRCGDWVWARLASVLPPPSCDAVMGDTSLPLAAVVATLEAWQRAGEVLGSLSRGGRSRLVDALAEQHALWVRAVPPSGPALAGTTVVPLPPDGADHSRSHLMQGSAAATCEVGRRGSVVVVARVHLGAGFVGSTVELVRRLLGQAAPVPRADTGVRRGPGASGRAIPTPDPAARDRTLAGTGRESTDAAPVPDERAAAPALEVPRLADRVWTEVSSTEVRTGPEAGPPVHDRSSGDGVPTRLAGVFYLVNPYRRLDLHRLGLADAAPWDVVEGLALAVVERDTRAAHLADHVAGEDPLWPVLQALAGRSPGESPAPDVRSRCETALVAVLEDLALTPAEPGLAELVAVPGRVLVDRTHVEVVLPIDAVDLAVRRRALDADPGWVPALGRVIRFHFVEDGSG